MKSLLSMAIFFLSLILSSAEILAPITLWPNGAPGALGAGSNDIPTMTPYLPDPALATGAAMIICPGGGYVSLGDNEGKDYAFWLNQHGITCFVLKFRLSNAGYHHPAFLQDATRAMRLVRAKAADWNIDPKRVGIIGSSGGGHLASTLLTHFDFGDTNSDDPVERQSSRPDLGILCYPIITLGQYTHEYTKNNLLGTNHSPELVQFLSNELQVTSNTPPCFIWATDEDKAVPVENSLLFAEALRKNGVPFELHLYQHGGHGIGLGDKAPFAHPHPWTGECLIWLKEHNFVK
jgi:acetyl esterase/lipase